MTQQRFDFQRGEVLLVDKPAGWSSFDVIRKLKDAVGAKIGHAGTLDPMATGLLILCTGKMTRQIERYQAAEKQYRATMILGATTPSYDAETTPQESGSLEGLSREDVLQTAMQFEGEIDQTPPPYSAVKVQGKRAYQRVRAGEDVALKSRRVRIYALEVLRIAWPEVTFFVRCGKGTYIRSLAHDWGQALGCGGYLSALRRTAIGTHSVDKAWRVEDLRAAIAPDQSPRS